MFYVDIYLGGKNHLLLTEKPICPKLFTEEAERLVVVALLRKNANLKKNLCQRVLRLSCPCQRVLRLSGLCQGASNLVGKALQSLAAIHKAWIGAVMYKTVAIHQLQRIWVFLIKLIFNCESLKKFIHLETEAQVFLSQKVQPVCEDSELFLEENNFQHFFLKIIV